MTAQEIFDGLQPDLANLAREEFCRISESCQEDRPAPLDIDVRKEPGVAFHVFSSILLTLFGRFHAMYDAELLAACNMSSVEMLLSAFGAQDEQRRAAFGSRTGQYLTMIAAMGSLSDEQFKNLLARSAETFH